MGERKYIGLDIETYDPCLQKRGWSWKYGEGYILCIALYEMSTGRSVVVAGLHNDNSPYSKERRFRLNNQIEQLLRDENVTLIGANIQYDLGWLLSEYAMDTFDVKCKFIDVLQAEAILNEHVSHSLEEVSNKYLGYGKVKARIEEWIKENIPNCKGDFRKYLKEAPYDLLEEYVTGDAANTCLVWKKQLTHLKKQELTERVKLEFNCILPALQMTINGFPFDNEQRKINCEYLTKIEETFAKQFQEKYNLPKFNVGSTKQVAAFLDAQGVPYKCKITLKGKNGQKYTTPEEKDRGYYEVKKMIQGFRLVKGEPIAYVPNKLAQRTCDILTEEGYIFNCSPNIDKNYYATMRESNETVAILADWKVCKGIISKLLSDEYERFIGTDGKLHPQFNITDTKTFRFSSQKMNCIAEGTRILTNKGYIPIEKLKVGDLVYNGNGNLTKVRNIWYKGERDCLSLVSAKGNKLVCTPDHKIWSGRDWVKAEELYEADIIERTDSVPVQSNADSISDSRVFRCRQTPSGRDSAKGIVHTRMERFKDKAQEQDCGSLHESTVSKTVRGGVHLGGATKIQGFVYKVQGILEQGKKFLESISDRGAKARTTQSEGSTSEIQTERSKWKARIHVQGRMFRHKRIHNACKHGFRDIPKSGDTQSGYGTGDRNKREFAGQEFASAPHRPQPLEQQLGQLGSMYIIRTQTVTQNACGVRKVYDIEVESSDHSFIGEGYRIKNCQQVPSKGGVTLNDGAFISFPALTRSLFKPEKGCVYVKIDYGQIEYRLICNIAVGKSGEEVRRAFQENPDLDFHQYTVDLTGLTRKLAKNLSFGVSFGMSIPSMAETFGWTLEHAQELYDQYMQHLPFVLPTLTLVGDIAKERGYIKTALGSHARLLSPNKAYTMLNRYTQGSGAEIMKASMVELYNLGLMKEMPFHATIHDELGFSVKPTEEQVACAYKVKDIMCNTVKLRVPLVADLEFGDDWYNVHSVQEWLDFEKEGAREWAIASNELKQVVHLARKFENIKED